LDRASVFGTEQNSTQPFYFKELTDFQITDSPDNSFTCFEVPLDLQNVILQWQSLPEHIWQTIRMLVETSGKKSDGA